MPVNPTLPTPGADDGTWGDELNAALGVIVAGVNAEETARAAADAALDTRVDVVEAALPGKAAAADVAALDTRLDTLEAAPAGALIAPAWAATTAYQAGQLVTYLGALYQRKTAGTSGASFAVADWNVLTSVQAIEDGVTPPDAPGVLYQVLAAAPAPDTTAPTVPTNLVATPSQTSVALSWTASTDAVGVTGYRVRRGGTLVGSPTGTSYTDTGLTASTGYSYTVSAIDAAGNESAQTSAVNTTTTSAPTAPGAPTGLTGTPATTSVALTWTAPASNGGSAITDYVVEYRTGANAYAVFADGTSTTTSATVTGLVASTSYDFRVSAVNAVGTGTPSTVFTVSTTSGAATPGSIIASDDFNRADTSQSLGTKALGTTPVGAKTWTYESDSLTNATARITSNRAQLVGSGSAPNNIYALIDAGVADVDLSVTLSTVGGGHGLVARFTSTSNFMRVVAGNGYDPGTASFKDGYFIEDGAGNRIGTGYFTTAPVAGDVMRLTCVGNVYTLYVNGTQRIQATSTAASATATRHGIWGSGTGLAHTHDDFIVKVP